MISVLLLALVGLPALLVGGYLVAVWPGRVPQWSFFAAGAVLIVLCLVAGEVAAAAEDSRLPAGCRTGDVVGLQCGFSLGRILGFADAAVVIVCLVVLAVVSLIRRSRRVPALVAAPDGQSQDCAAVSSPGTGRDHPGRRRDTAG